MNQTLGRSKPPRSRGLCVVQRWCPPDTCEGRIQSHDEKPRSACPERPLTQRTRCISAHFPLSSPTLSEPYAISSQPGFWQSAPPGAVTPRVCWYWDMLVPAANWTQKFARLQPSRRTATLQHTCQYSHRLGNFKWRQSRPLSQPRGPIEATPHPTSSGHLESAT